MYFIVLYKPSHDGLSILIYYLVFCLTPDNCVLLNKPYLNHMTAYNCLYMDRIIVFMYLFVDSYFTDLKNTFLQPMLDALSNTKLKK